MYNEGGVSVVYFCIPTCTSDWLFVLYSVVVETGINAVVAAAPWPTKNSIKITVSKFTFIAWDEYQTRYW